MVTDPDVIATLAVIFTERYTETVTWAHVCMQIISNTQTSKTTNSTGALTHSDVRTQASFHKYRHVALQAACPQRHTWTEAITRPTHGCRETHLAMQCDIQRQVSSGEMEPA